MKDWFQFYAREWNVPCSASHADGSSGTITGYELGDVAASRSKALVRPWRRWPGEARPRPAAEVMGLSRHTSRPLEGRAGDRDARALADHVLRRHDPDGPGRGGAGHPGGGRLLSSSCWRNCSSGWPTAWRPSRASGSASTGKACRSGASCSRLSDQFLQLKTCVVASTYCNSWIFEDLDPADPFRSMARAYSSIFICRGRRLKKQYIADGPSDSRLTASSTTTPRPVPTTRTAATGCRSGCPRSWASPTW